MATLRRLPLLAAAAALLAGCTTLGPDYERPVVELPAAYGRAAPAVGPQHPDARPLAPEAPQPAPTGPAELVDTTWWAAFGDPQLDALIVIALEENKALRLAAHRVEQLDAALQVSRAARMPQVGYQAGASRDALSQNRMVPLAPGVDPVGNNLQIGVAASWELDLWGRVSRANEEALANLMAAQENRRALVTSIVGEVAAAYVQLLTVDRDIELLEAVIASRRESVRLLERKFAGGRISELPLAAARIELANLLTGLPAKRREAATLEHVLSVLVGRHAGPVARGRTLDTLALPAIPAGVPAQVLAQRPDVRASEQALVAANARIGVARAQYLPAVTLTGRYGFASADLGRLLSLSSNVSSFGAALLGPIFDAGRIDGMVREAEAGQRAAATDYLRTVQTALREVEDALVWHARMAEQAQARAAHVQALADQAALVRRRVDGGVAELIEALGAERLVLEGQIAQGQTRRDQALALVAVYKALGGSWGVADHMPADLRVGAKNHD